MDLSENTAIGGAVMDVILWPVCLFWRTLSYTYTPSNMLAARQPCPAAVSSSPASFLWRLPSYCRQCTIFCMMLKEKPLMCYFSSLGAQVPPVHFGTTDLDKTTKTHRYPFTGARLLWVFWNNVCYFTTFLFVENFIWV